MTTTDVPVTLSGAEIDFTSLAAIAAGTARIVIPDAALERMARGRADFLRAMEGGQQIYGATTGVGAMKNTGYSGDGSRDAFSRSLPYAHQYAVGDEVPDTVARLTIALRLNTLLSGQVGASVELALFLREMLRHDLLPVMHRRGSAGCADLGQMGELATVMTGTGPARLGGQPMPAGAALARCGMAPHPMPPRDGLAAVATNSFGLAKSAVQIMRAGRSLRLAMALAVLGAQAMGVNRDVWAAAAEVALPNERRIARWLLAVTADATDWPMRTRVHDPLSARMLVQVLAACVTGMEEAAAAIRLESAHVDDNPLVVGGRVVTSGGSLLISLSMRLGGLQLVLAHLGRNILNRMLLMTGGLLEGLPVNLVPQGVIATGYGPVMKLALEQSVRMTAAASPVSVLNQTVAAGLEDEAAFISLSAGRVREQVDALDWLLAVEAMLTAQALDMQGLAPGRLGAVIRNAVRHHIAPLTEDVPQSTALMALHADLTHIAFHEALIAAGPLAGFDDALGLTPTPHGDGAV